MSSLVDIRVTPRADRPRRFELDDLRPPRSVAAPKKRGPKPKSLAIARPGKPKRIAFIRQ